MYLTSLEGFRYGKALWSSVGGTVSPHDFWLPSTYLINSRRYRHPIPGPPRERHGDTHGSANGCIPTTTPFTKFKNSYLIRTTGRWQPYRPKSGWGNQIADLLASGSTNQQMPRCRTPIPSTKSKQRIGVVFCGKWSIEVKLYVGVMILSITSETYASVPVVSHYLRFAP